MKEFVKENDDVLACTKQFLPILVGKFLVCSLFCRKELYRYNKKSISSREGVLESVGRRLFSHNKSIRILKTIGVNDIVINL